MHVERRRPHELEGARARTAVVIDVLRMTSTAAALMHDGACDAIDVAAAPEHLERLPRAPTEYVIVSELAGGAWPGAWVDNSPARVRSLELAGRTPVLVTTNGTGALLAAAAVAERVVLASFVDLRAVARHLAGVRDVVLVPAGRLATREARLEDDLCADALAALLAGREPDLAGCEAAIRAEPTTRQRVEREPGFAADLDAALAADDDAAALSFQPIDRGLGRIARATVAGGIAR